MLHSKLSNIYTSFARHFGYLSNTHTYLQSTLATYLTYIYICKAFLATYLTHIHICKALWLPFQHTYILARHFCYLSNTYTYLQGILATYIFWEALSCYIQHIYASCKALCYLLNICTLYLKGIFSCYLSSIYIHVHCEKHFYTI